MADELYDLLGAAVAALGLEVVDVELHAAVLRVVVDGPGGVDLEALSNATRMVSDVLDAHDPFPGRYTLEVSSPGVERPLRTPDHFARAVGETVTVRTVATTEGERRVQGRLIVADEEGIVVEGEGLPDGGRRLAYGDIDRARTVFMWGGAPKPSEARRRGSARRRSASSSPGADRERVTTP
jgi:ribosome maturation factor RimP